MDEKFLKELGIDDADAISKIIKKQKDEMHDTLAGRFIPKDRFDEINNRAKEYKELLETAKADAEEADGLRKELEDLKKASREMEEKYAREDERRRHIDAIRKNLPDDIIDPDDVLGRLDIDAYKYRSDGTVSGLSEDIEALRKSKPHYFKAKDEGDNSQDGHSQRNNPLFGIVGMQPPANSSEGKNDDDKPQDVMFGQMLAQMRMGADTQAARAREAYFGGK